MGFAGDMGYDAYDIDDFVTHNRRHEEDIWSKLHDCKHKIGAGKEININLIDEQYARNLYYWYLRKVPVEGQYLAKQSKKLKLLAKRGNIGRS